nr:Gp138 family membrane-puncturing spike protein [Kofleriaceae bacterium]
MIDPLVAPDLAQAIMAYVDGRIALDVHVSLPARVVTFYAATQTCDVQPLIQFARADEFGNRVVESLPPLVGVPVAYPRALEFPLEPGDTVLLVFASASIGTWLRGNAASNEPVDPQLDSHHELSDAIAIPCSPRRLADAIADFTSEAVVVRAGGTAGEVRLGGPSASADSNRVVVQSALNVFMSALAAAITALGADPSASALAALQTQLGSSWDAGTTTTKAL